MSGTCLMLALGALWVLFQEIKKELGGGND
jgi:hypothetical protein